MKDEERKEEIRGLIRLLPKDSRILNLIAARLGRFLARGVSDKDVAGVRQAVSAISPVLAALMEGYEEESALIAHEWDEYDKKAREEQEAREAARERRLQEELANWERDG